MKKENTMYSLTNLLEALDKNLSAHIPDGHYVSTLSGVHMQILSDEKEGYIETKLIDENDKEYGSLKTKYMIVNDDSAEFIEMQALVTHIMKIGQGYIKGLEWVEK